MSNNERWYYLERAQTALKLAKLAIDPAIARIHLEMHRLYLDRADEFVPHASARELQAIAANQR